MAEEKKLRPGELRFEVRQDTAKHGGVTVFYAYDKVMASRPGIRHGRLIEASTERPEIETIVDWLNEMETDESIARGLSQLDQAKSRDDFLEEG